MLTSPPPPPNYDSVAASLFAESTLPRHQTALLTTPTALGTRPLPAMRPPMPIITCVFVCRFVVATTDHASSFVVCRCNRPCKRVVRRSPYGPTPSIAAPPYRLGSSSFSSSFVVVRRHRVTLVVVVSNAPNANGGVYAGIGAVSAIESNNYQTMPKVDDGYGVMLPNNTGDTYNALPTLVRFHFLSVQVFCSPTHSLFMFCFDRSISEGRHVERHITQQLQRSLVETVRADRNVVPHRI